MFHKFRGSRYRYRYRKGNATQYQCLLHVIIGKWKNMNSRLKLDCDTIIELWLIIRDYYPENITMKFCRKIFCTHMRLDCHRQK